jgi:hypothetical protein
MKIVKFRVRWTREARAILKRALAEAGGPPLQPYFKIPLTRFQSLKARCRLKGITVSRLLSHTVVKHEEELRAFCRALRGRLPWE